jgi:hypothetical protein
LWGGPQEHLSTAHAQQLAVATQALRCGFDASRTAVGAIPSVSTNLQVSFRSFHFYFSNAKRFSQTLATDL